LRGDMQPRLRLNGVAVDTVTVLNRRAVEYLENQRVRGDDSARFAAGELLAAFIGALGTVPSVWINHPVSNTMARHKLVQLAVAMQIGLDVPPSLLTNSLDLLREFTAIAGPLVYKTIGVHHMYGKRRVYTTPIDGVAVRQNDLNPCPAFVQSELRKRRDVRVTVVGERQFGACADSVVDDPVDWRYSNAARWRPWAIPQLISEQINQLMDYFKLTFAAIDFVETTAGEVVFLEVNPNGQWLWLQAATESDIAAAIADELNQQDRNLSAARPSTA